MMIKLFDIQNGVVVPTEHCYTLRSLKAVIDEYPDQDDHMKILQYVFYMTCPNPDINPFFNVPEIEKEELIVEQIDMDISLEDDVIQEALQFCKKLYETPTYRAFHGIKNMLDHLADYMSNATITDGRDGNITALVNTAKNFDSIRASFKSAFKDLSDEQKSSVRGGQQLSYDG